jgi:hypothetical protein
MSKFKIKEMSNDELLDLFIKMCNAMADDEDLYLDEYDADFESVEKEMLNRDLL